MGEAAEDGFTRGDFNEMEDGESKEDQDGVGEPGVQGDEVKALGHMVGVKKLEDVEVQEVEAVAALANKEEGAPGEEGGDGVGSTEAENEGGEDGGEESSVHEEVGGVEDEGVEEGRDCGEADGGENEALPRGQDKGVLQLAESDTGEEGADVRERSVLQEADELGGAVSVDRANDVVGVQVEVESVRDEAQDP